MDKFQFVSPVFYTIYNILALMYYIHYFKVLNRNFESDEMFKNEACVFLIAQLRMLHVAFHQEPGEFLSHLSLTYFILRDRRLSGLCTDSVLSWSSPFYLKQLSKPTSVGFERVGKFCGCLCRKFMQLQCPQWNGNLDKTLILLHHGNCTSSTGPSMTH